LFVIPRGGEMRGIMGKVRVEKKDVVRNRGAFLHTLEMQKRGSHEEKKRGRERQKTGIKTPEGVKEETRRRKEEGKWSVTLFFGLI